MRRVQADIINLRPPNEQSNQENEQSEISGDEGQEQKQDQEEEQGWADNDDVEHEVTVPTGRRVRVNLGETAVTLGKIYQKSDRFGISHFYWLYHQIIYLFIYLSSKYTTSPYLSFVCWFLY